MSTNKVSVERLFDGERYLHNQSIYIEHGKIVAIEDCTVRDQYLTGTMIPGFIDVQVNGGGGVLFNETPTKSAIETIGRAHQQFGTTGWLPTLVTDSFEKMTLAADAVAEARRCKIAGVLGVHFEGPHLSTDKKGIHEASLIRNISDQEMQLFSRTDLGKVVVTVAPESITNEQIQQLTAAGVLVCLGHSNASYQQSNLALDAGATGFTHLFNAMSAFTSREPGMLGAALLDQGSYAGLILDGIHVHPDSARLAYKLKPRIMLVTDAMPPVGTEQKTFEFFGSTIVREGDRLTDADGRLAGSALDMMTAVKNAQRMLNIELKDAVTLASRNPANFLGLNRRYGRIQEGYVASFILIDKNQSVCESWIEGRKVI